MIESEEECSICFIPLYDHKTITMECGHKYHKKCIINWLKTKNVCPLCNEQRNMIPLPPSPKGQEGGAVCPRCTIS
jgi:hypothetical protein